MGFRLATCLFAVLLLAPTTWAAPLDVVSGLPGATGLTINAGTGDLYVKSGASGTVWRVPVGDNGDLGTAEVVSNDLGTALDLEFDLAGNLWGVVPGGRPFSLFVRRLASGSTFAQQTNLSPDGFISGDTSLVGAFAIEAPGGVTNRLFLVAAFSGLYSFQLGAFAPSRSTSTHIVGGTCSLRSLAYRPRFADLIGSVGTLVVRVSPNDGACTGFPGGTGFVQPNGVAWDNTGQHIYVVDTATGELIVIKPDGSRVVLGSALASPVDVAFDAGYVFVSEPVAGRVSIFSATPPTATPSHTRTSTATFTPTPSATDTRTVTPTRTPSSTPTDTSTPTVTATQTDTRTPTLTATATSTPTITPTPADTATPTITQTSSPSPSPSATSPLPPCGGDCDGSGQVTVDKIVLLVNIALGNGEASSCAAGDGNNDDQITVDEIITAVNNALTGCPA